MVVEDEPDIGSLLTTYFESKGYEVTHVELGEEALESCWREQPDLLILDINLPDIDGYNVCKELRSNRRTAHIPVLFLTQKDERSDMLKGLELGADDYVTKPFDIEILRLRVRNALRNAKEEISRNPVTRLLSGKMIEDQIKRAVRQGGWAIIYIGISNFAAFNDVHGFAEADDVLRFTSKLILEVVDELDSPDDFVGHVGSDTFIIITSPDRAGELREKMITRFNEEIKSFYNFREVERGYMKVKDEDGEEKQYPLMELSVGVLTNEDGPFSDIREITEVAAEKRRKMGSKIA